MWLGGLCSCGDMSTSTHTHREREHTKMSICFCTPFSSHTGTFQGQSTQHTGQPTGQGDKKNASGQMTTYYSTVMVLGLVTVVAMNSRDSTAGVNLDWCHPVQCSTDSWRGPSSQLLLIRDVAQTQYWSRWPQVFRSCTKEQITKSTL